MNIVNNNQGFSLLEVLAALSIFGLLAAGMGPIFMQQLSHNRLAEVKTEAMGAAQIVLDRIRTQDPATLPSTGSGSAQSVVVGARTYSVTPSYCEDNSFCTSSNVRHVRVRVHYNGQQVFVTQTVYAQLR